MAKSKKSRNSKELCKDKADKAKIMEEPNKCGSNFWKEEKCGLNNVQKSSKLNNSNHRQSI